MYSAGLGYYARIAVPAQGCLSPSNVFWPHTAAVKSDSQHTSHNSSHNQT